ncbi:MAG: DUF559 domain-containing protein [Proteobacteria bacterium]|nr:DUF559 domain-containing protein [Pseudomonadota bacterium]
MADLATLKRRACELRNSQTAAERRLWARLRLRQVCGVRFLRQYVVGNFILDFYAPAIRLAIELDGGQHYDPDVQRYDASRTHWLVTQGISVLRYTHVDVARMLDDVMNEIELAVSRQRAHPPDALHRPPSFRRG